MITAPNIPPTTPPPTALPCAKFGEDEELSDAGVAVGLDSVVGAAEVAEVLVG